MSNTIEVDVAIIGAGIVGTCCAYFSTIKFPTLTFALLEKNLIGRGVTDFSVGLNLAYGHTDFKYKLTEKSINLWNMLETKIKELPIYSLSVYPIFHKNKLALMQKQLIGTCVPQTSILLNKLNRHLPGFQIRENQFITKPMKGSYAKTRLVTEKIAEKINKKNLYVFEGLSVNNIELTEKQVIVHMYNLKIAAKKIILAVGPWLLEYPFNYFSIKTVIRTKKIVSFYIRKMAKRSAPVCYFFDEDAFLLPLYNRGYYILSITVQDWDVSPTDPLFANDADYQQAYKILETYCPELKSSLCGARVFCDSYLNNFTPIIGCSPTDPRVILCSGASGSGFRLAPAMACEALSCLAEESYGDI